MLVTEQLFDPLYYPYPSKRMVTVSRNGMVASSQALASQVGLDILKKGGNAVDAAIATAAALTVLEPISNGIGGDAFALVWMKDELYGINGSGPAPKSISIDAVKSKGHSKMPVHGWIPVTVPGAPATWAALSERFGRLDLTTVLQPAIDYAEKGFPLSPVLASIWGKTYKENEQALTEEMYQEWFATFGMGGRAPQVGELWKSPNHAKTLRAIATTKAESFYRGPLADKMVEFSSAHGGFLQKEDLKSYYPEWVQPISVTYKGHEVWEIPPNGQGLIALMGLNMLNGFSLKEKESVDTYHKQIEAMKLAFTDGKEYITDSRDMSQSVEALLSDAYAEERRKLIQQEAMQPSPGQPPLGGTVYLATADGEGNMVSFIQSNYMDFGSGLVVPGTGIALQNRGHTFSLEEGHNNALKGGKKTYHTIIPGFLTKDDKAVGPFGVMGGFMQPQGHLQVVSNLVDFHLNPQAALDAPRWRWLKDKKIIVEPHFSSAIAEALERRGHEVAIHLDVEDFGRGQIIVRDPDTGTLYGGTESRTDSTIAAY